MCLLISVILLQKGSSSLLPGSNASPIKAAVELCLKANIDDSMFVLIFSPLHFCNMLRRYAGHFWLHTGDISGSWRQYRSRFFQEASALAPVDVGFERALFPDATGPFSVWELMKMSRTIPVSCACVLPYAALLFSCCRLQQPDALASSASCIPHNPAYHYHNAFLMNYSAPGRVTSAADFAAVLHLMVRDDSDISSHSLQTRIRLQVHPNGKVLRLKQGNSCVSISSEGANLVQLHDARSVVLDDWQAR
jgi:hypothetical protein